LTPETSSPYTAAVSRRLLVVLALALAGASTAAAEHRAYYRFLVLGYVTDGLGHPVRAEPIKLIRDKTGFSYLAATDDTGFYLVVCRLGDENVGERLTLKIGRVVTRISARFDPKNHADDRGTRVDLAAGKPIERAAWFPSTLRRFLGSK